MMDDYVDHINSMATDILECPKCDCESLEMTGQEYDYTTDVRTEKWRCLECGHSFENQS